MEASGETVKATYYIDTSVLDRLDLAQVALRRLTGKRGHELSKSAIVQAALHIALVELEEKGEESRLAEALSDE